MKEGTPRVIEEVAEYINRPMISWYSVIPAKAGIQSFSWMPDQVRHDETLTLLADD
jgi:hypothetical protein